MPTEMERILADHLSFLKTEDAKRRWLGVWDVLKQIPDPPEGYTNLNNETSDMRA